MPTQCIEDELDLGRSGGRKLVGAFDGGAITSNGGVPLIAGADRRLRLAERLAACFTEHRFPEASRHSVPEVNSSEHACLQAQRSGSPIRRPRRNG